MAKRAFLLHAVSAVAACGAPTIPSATLTSIGDGCEEWGCGTNSASMGKKIVFHELDASGSPNEAQLVLRGLFGKAGAHYRRYKFEVDHDQLKAGLAADHRTAGALVGMFFVLEYMPTHQFYTLEIVGVRSTNFWAPPESEVPVYDLVYHRVGDPGPRCSLCRGPDGNARCGYDDPAAWFSFPAPGMVNSNTGTDWLVDLQVNPEDPADPLGGGALMFRGDRYNDKKKTDRDTGADRRDGWFNVSCGRIAPTKLHLMRHTWASMEPEQGIVTVQWQRQAMLKMITADYCGTGKSFTMNGVPLHYAFKQGWLPSGASAPNWSRLTPGSLEATWNDMGARCLGQPRIANLTDIQAECQKNGKTLVTNCGAPETYWNQSLPSEYVISVNP